MLIQRFSDRYFLKVLKGSLKSSQIDKFFIFQIGIVDFWLFNRFQMKFIKCNNGILWMAALELVKVCIESAS